MAGTTDSVCYHPEDEIDECCRPGCEKHNQGESVTGSYNIQYKYNRLNNVCIKLADSAAKVSHTYRI